MGQEGLRLLWFICSHNFKNILKIISWTLNQSPMGVSPTCVIFVPKVLEKPNKPYEIPATFVALSKSF